MGLFGAKVGRKMGFWVENEGAWLRLEIRAFVDGTVWQRLARRRSGAAGLREGGDCFNGCSKSVLFVTRASAWDGVWVFLRIVAPPYMARDCALAARLAHQIGEMWDFGRKLRVIFLFLPARGLRAANGRQNS